MIKLTKKSLNSKFLYYNTNSAISVESVFNLMTMYKEHSLLSESIIKYLIPDFLNEFEFLKFKYKDFLISENKLCPFMFSDETIKKQFLQELIGLCVRQRSLK